MWIFIHKINVEVTEGNMKSLFWAKYSRYFFLLFKNIIYMRCLSLRKSEWNEFINPSYSMGVVPKNHHYLCTLGRIDFLMLKVRVQLRNWAKKKRREISWTRSTVWWSWGWRGVGGNGREHRGAKWWWKTLH